MISQKEFLEIFKEANTEIEEDALKAFYRSVKKSILYSYGGEKSTLSILFDLEKSYQWPILKKIDDPALPIYKGVNQALLNAFINSIKSEKHLKGIEIKPQERDLTEGDAWTIFRLLIKDRLELYKEIFDFSPEDLAKYEKIWERYERNVARREKNNLKKSIAIGTGIAVLGAAIYKYYQKRKGGT